MKHSIPVIIPEEVRNEIKYLCSQISEVEWSGVLFYSVEGSIKDPATLKFTLEEIFPMDKGTGAATNYSLDAEDNVLVGHMMENPNLLKCRMGHIHSHNKMTTFFSGTDMSELNDNSEFHNYYLSVIVNNAGDIDMKLAMRGSMNLIIKDEKGENIVIESAEQSLIVYPCHRYVEIPVVKHTFIERVKAVIAKSKVAIQKFNQEFNRAFVPETNQYPYKNSYPPAGRSAALDAKGGYAIGQSPQHFSNHALQEPEDEDLLQQKELEHEEDLEELIIGLLVNDYDTNVSSIGVALIRVEKRLDKGKESTTDYCIGFLDRYFEHYFKKFGDKVTTEDIIEDFDQVRMLLEDFAEYHSFVNDLTDAIYQLSQKYENQLIITNELQDQD